MDITLPTTINKKLCSPLAPSKLQNQQQPHQSINLKIKQ